MKLKRIITAAFTALLLPIGAISADTDQGYAAFSASGDVNGDGYANIADIVTLQNWLLCRTDSYLADWSAGDLCGNGKLDVFDLCLLKRLVFTQQPEIENNELIPSQISQFGAPTPTTGNVKALNIYVDFADVKYADYNYDTEQIREEFYGNGAVAPPYESLTAWFERSSYGNLHLEGDVVHYTCSGNMADYSQGRYNYTPMATEVLKGLEDELDFSDYDSNGDGAIDCLTFTVPLDYASDEMKDFWYACTNHWYGDQYFTVDGMRVEQYIIMDVMPNPNDMKYLKSTMIHEMCHSMGLPDYYAYDSDPYDGVNDGGESLKGDAGYECMDDAIGDLCSFSKLMFGWLRENEVQSYSGYGEQTFILDDASQTGSCLILPINSTPGDYTSEYFLIENISRSGNNFHYYTYDSGVRIFHVKAELNQYQFKYDNYSPYFMGNDKVRVLRLVNDDGGFYHSGDIVGFGTSNFAAYDFNGYPTIDTGYTVSIGEHSDGKYTITVSR